MTYQHRFDIRNEAETAEIQYCNFPYRQIVYQYMTNKYGFKDYSIVDKECDDILQ